VEEQAFLCSPWRDHGGAGTSMQTMGRPHAGAQKNVRRHEWHKGAVVD